MKYQQAEIMPAPATMKVAAEIVINESVLTSIS
jgi:hypothetical protein